MTGEYGLESLSSEELAHFEGELHQQFREALKKLSDPQLDELLHTVEDQERERMRAAGENFCASLRTDAGGGAPLRPGRLLSYSTIAAREDDAKQSPKD